MPPEETHVDHDEIFTGPNRQNIINAKAATLILRGVITTGQPPDASDRQAQTRVASRGQSGPTPGNGNTTPTATTPPNLSRRMAAIFAGLPTPTTTPSPDSGTETERDTAKENQPPPQNGKAKDRRLVPNGPRPLMRRVISATGVGLGVKGRGFSTKHAAARDRAASAHVAGMAGGDRRRSSRLMNLYNSNSSDQAEEGHDDNVDDDETEIEAVPPSKKVKKIK